MQANKKFLPEKDLIVLEISGKITIGAGDYQLHDAILEAGHHHILLDCGGLSVIDASGIGELAGSLGSVAKHGHKLYLANVPPKIEELLRVTRIIRAFTVFPDQKAAIAAF